MGERFGNYEILRRLAQGGMAEVLLAKQQGLGGFERLVCLKRILPHLSGQEEFLKMFQDEARIAANLLHPNVAQIYDIGTSDGQYYIAMEYVRGEDLRRVYNQEVSRGHSMPRHVAALIVMGAAAGLHYAHRQTALDGTPLQIVHRDVSPQNILVTYDGHVKLIDFGVAKAAGKLNQTRAGVLKGKYSYMSPEQASGDPVDARTDIFALGTTLYEITTGTRLFKRDNELETLHAVIACNVPPPSEVVPDYDAQLEAIVRRALAYDASQRYQTAADLERDLEAYLRAQRQPTSASSLGAYMQDLFAAKLAEEGGPPPEVAARSLPEPASRRPTPPTAVVALEAEATVATPIAPPAGEQPAGASGRGPAARPAMQPVGDEEATTVDAQAPQAPLRPPADAEAPRPATATETPSDWQTEEVDELTGNARALNGDPAATFLPAKEAAQAEREAALAWHDAPQPAPRSDRAAAARQPPPQRRRPPPGKRRWAAWGVFAGIVLGAAAYGVQWRHRVAARARLTAAPEATGQPDGPSPATADAKAGQPAPPAPAGWPPATDADQVSPPPQMSMPHPIPPGQAGLDVAAPLPLTVTLGGSYLGETPLLGVAVAPGTLHVKLENRQEGLLLWRKLRLPRGESRRLQVEVGRGRLAVEAHPWAWVQRGLYPAAETPRDETLWAGDYVLTVECPDGRRRAQAVQVRDQQTTRVQLDCR